METPLIKKPLVFPRHTLQECVYIVRSILKKNFHPLPLHSNDINLWVNESPETSKNFRNKLSSCEKYGLLQNLGLGQWKITRLSQEVHFSLTVYRGRLEEGYPCEAVASSKAEYGTYIKKCILNVKLWEDIVEKFAWGKPDEIELALFLKKEGTPEKSISDCIRKYYYALAFLEGRCLP